VVEWSRVLDVRLSEWCCSVSTWCGFKSRRGKNKNLTALKSNSNTVWFNFQTYIYCCQIIILSIYVPSTHAYKHVLRLSLDLSYEKR
jgi:hypothetical protein